MHLVCIQMLNIARPGRAAEKRRSAAGLSRIWIKTAHADPSPPARAVIDQAQLRRSATRCQYLGVERPVRERRHQEPWLASHRDDPLSVRAKGDSGAQQLVADGGATFRVDAPHTDANYAVD
jgi:hypothetical protein